jgi:hypothetical protein
MVDDYRTRSICLLHAPGGLRFRRVRFQESAGVNTSSRTKKVMSAAVLFLRVSMNEVASHQSNEIAETVADRPSARVKFGIIKIANNGSYLGLNTFKERHLHVCSHLRTTSGLRRRLARASLVRAKPCGRTHSAGVLQTSSELPLGPLRRLSTRGVRRAGFECGHPQSRRRLHDVVG